MTMNRKAARKAVEVLDDWRGGLHREHISFLLERLATIQGDAEFQKYMQSIKRAWDRKMDDLEAPEPV